MNSSVAEAIEIVGRDRVASILVTFKQMGQDFEKMDEDQQEKVLTVLLTAELAKMHHLYTTMTEQNWEDRTQAGDDVWVRNRLNNYKCFSRDDVKQKYNALAKKLGHEGKLLP